MPHILPTTVPALLSLALAAHPCAQLSGDEPIVVTIARDAPAVALHARARPLRDATSDAADPFPWLAAPEVAAKRHEHAAAAFRALLPAGAVAVGTVWHLDAAALLPFVRQLHAGAAIPPAEADTKHAVACLRTASATEAEILLRVHAQLVLRSADETGNALRLQPAQFEGRLVVDRQRERVLAFSLQLPDHRPNVALAIDGEPFADTGRIATLEVASRPRPNDDEGAPGLSLAAARSRLQRELYACAALHWHDLESALAQSRATGRPMHVVAMQGCLLDESCGSIARQLRARVLGDGDVRDRLAAGFVNCWVPARELRHVFATTARTDLATLCELVMQEHRHAVDVVLVTPALQVVGRRRAEHATGAPPGDYVGWLDDGLQAARR